MKFALCNEVLQPLPFPQQCSLAAQLGYDGLELAPFTLVPDPTELTDAEIEGFRRVAEDHGLRIFGLHWLLVAPAGLSIVSPDAALRQRTKQVMVRLVEICAALGGSYLVHGSPTQRSVPQGSTRDEAWERARECLSGAASAAARCRVTYCLEPLSPRETDLFNSVEEAVRMIDEIGQPSLRTMVDCSAAGQAESLQVDELLTKWGPRGVIGHVQVNDPNRRGPGQGELDFAPILDALTWLESERHFPGIVGVEPFDYVPDGPGCAAWSIGYLRGVLKGLHAND
jgi:D-psicose/D-tagatose/L-ribulose 3-epimerase